MMCCAVLCDQNLKPQTRNKIPEKNELKAWIVFSNSNCQEQAARCLLVKPLCEVCCVAGLPRPSCQTGPQRHVPQSCHPPAPLGFPLRIWPTACPLPSTCEQNCLCTAYLGCACTTRTEAGCTHGSCMHTAQIEETCEQNCQCISYLGCACTECTAAGCTHDSCMQTDHACEQIRNCIACLVVLAHNNVAAGCTHDSCMQTDHIWDTCEQSCECT